MKILLFIADLVLIAPIGYILWLFLGFENPISIFLLCIIVTFNLTVMAHYMAQMSYEIIAIDEEAKAEDEKYAKLEKERAEELRHNKNF